MTFVSKDSMVSGIPRKVRLCWGALRPPPRLGGGRGGSAQHPFGSESFNKRKLLCKAP